MMVLLALRTRANKEPKGGGSGFGRRKLWKESEGHNRLMRMYFNEHPTFP
jgi:hypothetical protein